MAEQQLTAWQPWALLVGKSTLTVLLAVQLAALSWRVIAPEPLLLAAPSKGGSPVARQTDAGAAQYHLFGEAGVEPVKAVTEEVAAPETRLRLKLLGVTRSTRQETSSAIIAPPSGEGDFYRIGDVIQGGTRLAAVYEDRVILDTNGKLETLKFDEAPRTGVSATVVERPEPAVARPAGGLRERFREVRNPSDFMAVISEEAGQDPEDAIRQLGLETAGGGQGYRVQPGSMLTALQLQPGDIVLSVNGQALGDPQADQQLLQQVSAEGTARIEVQRGNNRFVVNHSLN